MSEAAPAPPTKPRGARRWVWLVVLLLPLLAYVGGYAALRVGRRFVLSRSIDDSTIVGERIAVVGTGIGTRTETNVVTVRDLTLHQSPTLSAFRPCIAVEEWWGNR